jgi:hypothetical protein
MPSEILAKLPNRSLGTIAAASPLSMAGLPKISLESHRLRPIDSTFFPLDRFNFCRYRSYFYNL